MRAFAIIETNVTAYPSLTEAKQAVAAAPDSEPRLAITSEAELAASPLTLGQLTDIWNGFAGVVPFEDLKPVRKLTDRKTAVARIWRSIQRLALAPETAPAAPPVAQDAPKAAQSRKATTQKQKVAPARPGSKKAQISALLSRPEGATLAELQATTGWQPHSLRGFLSGTLVKKLGYIINRRKREDGASVYFFTE
ncbi:MAG: DUF3489 domain-containing protein [Bryobacteraceae bacterium]